VNGYDFLLNLFSAVGAALPMIPGKGWILNDD
jgi:hypothetical protein